MSVTIIQCYSQHFSILKCHSPRISNIVSRGKNSGSVPALQPLTNQNNCSNISLDWSNLARKPHCPLRLILRDNLEQPSTPLTPPLPYSFRRRLKKSDLYSSIAISNMHSAFGYQQYDPYNFHITLFFTPLTIQFSFQFQETKLVPDRGYLKPSLPSYLLSQSIPKGQIRRIWGGCPPAIPACPDCFCPDLPHGTSDRA